MPNIPALDWLFDRCRVFWRQRMADFLNSKIGSRVESFRSPSAPANHQPNLLKFHSLHGLICCLTPLNGALETPPKQVAARHGRRESAMHDGTIAAGNCPPHQPAVLAAACGELHARSREQFVSGGTNRRCRAPGECRACPAP